MNLDHRTMRFFNREQLRQPQKSERYEYRNEKERDTILCPISITNGRRPLLVEIKLDPGHGGLVSSSKLNEGMQKANEVHSYDSTLTKLRMVFVDKAGTTTTSTTAILASPFSSEPASSLISSFSFDSEQSSCLPSFSNDSNDANEVNVTSLADYQIQLDFKKHNEIHVETGKCEENIVKHSSEESYNLSDHSANDSSRTRYFQDLSEYGAKIIKLKREIDFIQHIQKHMKLINFEVDWRMKQKRIANKMHLADREKNLQRLYAKSREEYRMEGRRRREDIAQMSALKSEERKNGFRT